MLKSNHTVGTEAKIIYGMFDPDSGDLVYVGASCQDLRKRMSSHKIFAKSKSTSRLAVWLREKLSAGKRIVLTPLFPTVDWQAAEKLAVAGYRKVGYDLLNETDGGFGCAGLSPSENTRAKRSASLKKFYEDPEKLTVRQELCRNAARSQKARDAAKARMSAIWADPEASAHMRSAMKGAKRRKHAEDTSSTG